MSQKTVEIVLGKLVTDEEVRRRFRVAPREVLDSVRREGWDLSTVETEALRSLDPVALERFALSLDPRLQKASLQTSLNDDPSQET